MKLHELQHIVIVEAICLLLITLIILSAFKRWRTTLITSCILATIAFFSTWSNIMAGGSMLVYGSASTLLWWQMDKKNDNCSSVKKRWQTALWAILAAGVAILIANNTHNIFVYLR